MLLLVVRIVNSSSYSLVLPCIHCEPENVELPSTSGARRKAVESLGRGFSGASSVVSLQQKHI